MHWSDPPIFGGDKISNNPWESEKTAARILSDHCFYTLLVRKWHIRQQEGMVRMTWALTNSTAFTRRKEYTQSVYPERYPDLFRDADKLERHNAIGANHVLIHGLKDGTTQSVKTVSSTHDMVESDRMLRDYSVKSIGELAGGDKPFYIAHAFTQVHADNFATDEFRGASASKYQ